MLWNQEITKCPLGYCCQAMTGFHVSDCPNLETCMSLTPYHLSEFPTWNSEVEQPNSTDSQCRDRTPLIQLADAADPI